jgi:outer membrane protein assembly factor BamC
MIKFNRTGLIISAVVLPIFTGCGLKSYFPDKEKDYQFRQEIAPLTIPQDLKDNTFKRSLIAPEKDETEKVMVVIEDKVSRTDNDNTNSIEYIEVVDDTVTADIENISNSTDSEDKVTQVDFVMFDGGATRLRINENFSPVWRLVAKALSRNRIEITSRNKAGGQLVVQYDPDKTDFVDDSVKDEFLFIFGSDHSQEKEYRIRLIRHNNNIEVIVLNDENQPLSDGAGLKLLKLLFSTLHTELITQK